MHRLGIDVSDNQGHIDWTKVKAAGVEFAILRSVRHSGNPDKQLASNIAGCKQNGILFDFYKYQYAVTRKQSVEEARRVIEVLLSMGIEPSTDTVIWDDIEDKSILALGKAAVLEIAKGFQEEIEAAGFGYGLYMGKYAYENQFCGERFAVALWIARYYKGYQGMQFGVMPDEQYQPTPARGSGATLWGWQFTSSGRVNGIEGNVDMNIAYYDIKESAMAPLYYESPEFTLIDSLNKIGVESSYAHRKKIAVANGIAEYTGTAEQNMYLLQLLWEGKLLRE